jgi:hypothetical protein
MFIKPDFDSIYCSDAAQMSLSKENRLLLESLIWYFIIVLVFTLRMFVAILWMNYDSSSHLLGHLAGLSKLQGKNSMLTIG